MLLKGQCHCGAIRVELATDGSQATKCWGMPMLVLP